MKKLIIGFFCLVAVATALEWKILGHADTWYVHSNTFRAELFNQIWLGDAFVETLLQYDVGDYDALFFKGTLGYEILWGFAPVIQYEYGSWGSNVFRVGLRWNYYFGGEF